MHLAGHKEECKLFVEWLQKDAKRSEKSLPVYIAKFLNQTDEDFVSTGKLMQKTCERYEKLTFAYNSLEQSSLLKRPFVFLQHADWEIVKETFRGFIPGFSFSIESFLYAMVAFFLWSLIWCVICKKKTPEK